jgi:2,4-dienoyl-CoA reductase-like NADH-dependent reductase (Old Yellow Enzyme family)
VAHAVRTAAPPGMPVFYRASAIDMAEGGVRLEDTLELAHALKDVGIDLIDCSAGGIVAADPTHIEPLPEPGHLVPLARAARLQAGIPTMAVGRIDRPALAEDVVASGSADLVALGRALLSDPNFAYRAALELQHQAPHEVLPAPYARALKGHR